MLIDLNQYLTECLELKKDTSCPVLLGQLVELEVRIRTKIANPERHILSREIEELTRKELADHFSVPDDNDDDDLFDSTENDGFGNINMELE